MDQRLLNFILEARRLGATNDQIIDLLVKKGYSNDQILLGFVEADKQLPANDVSTDAFATGETVTLTEPPVEPHGDISAFAAPPVIQPYTPPQPRVFASQQYADPRSYTPPSVKPVQSRLSMPRYVNDSLKEPVKVSKKAVMVGIVALFLVTGGWLAYRMGIVSSTIALFQGSRSSTAAFAQYEQIPKDTAILLNDSVRFTVTGFQMMSSEEFNDLQEGSGAQIDEGNQALLIYYTLQNTSDTVQVITTSEGDLRTFAIMDKKRKRIDVDSGALDESLTTLTDLKPKQYTSNALIFEIPRSYTDSHELYFVLQSDAASPQKGYLQL